MGIMLHKAVKREKKRKERKEKERKRREKKRKVRTLEELGASQLCVHLFIPRTWSKIFFKPFQPLVSSSEEHSSEHDSAVCRWKRYFHICSLQRLQEEAEARETKSEAPRGWLA